MRTYDIINAGPRNRFMANGRIVSNSGRLVQVQNLPQNKLKDIDLARNLMKAGDFDAVDSLFGNVFDTLSQLIRTAFVARPGHKFVIVDFSAIEARVVAWLAWCQWRIDVFNTHGKIYEASAEQMFKLPPGSVDKKSPYRQKGKVAELACIAEGELVLTDGGLVPIEQVTTAMKVWDGYAFVPHEGIIYRGIKEVITYDGLTATPDHIVWAEEGPCQFGDAASRGSRLVQSGSGGHAIRVGGDHQPRKAIHKELVGPVCSGALHGMWRDAMVCLRQLDLGQIQRLPSLLSATTGAVMVKQEGSVYAKTVHELGRPGLRELRWARDYVRVLKRFGSLALGRGQPWFASGFGAGSDRQQRPLRPGQFEVCHSRGAVSQSAPVKDDGQGGRMGARRESSWLSHYLQLFTEGVLKGRDYWGGIQGCTGETQELERHQGQTRTARVYDLINCGPHHRFTVSGKLVHNCGYQGGKGALKTMGALEMGLTEDDLQPIIDRWRGANPEIVQLWYACENAAKDAVARKASIDVPIAGGRSKLTFVWESGFLFITLPSGRRLAYVKPRIEAEDLYREKSDGSKFQIARAGSLTYEGLDQKTKQWTRLSTYGGKLVENITQAIARDLLAESMLALDDEGFNLLTTVHDEIVAEEEIAGSRDVHLAEQIMGRPIPWAKDLPLRGDGFETPYYMKEID